MNNSNSLGRRKFWVVFLLCVLVLLNVFAFYVYQNANPNNNSWLQLWEYLQSDAFSYITISLLLPIISLFLENLFEVRKIIEEKIEKEKQAGIKERWECIQKTIKVWNEFFNFVLDVAYFKETNGASDDNKKDKKMSPQTIRKKIEKQVTLAFEQINSVYFKFPNLESENQENTFQGDIVYLTNVLYNSVVSVIYQLEHCENIVETKELQQTLLTIHDGVRSLLYHRMLLVLKYSVYVWEGKKEGNLEKIEDSNAKINECITALNEDANWIKKYELIGNNFFLQIKGQKGKKLQEASKKVEELAIKYSTENEIIQSAEYQNFKQIFRTVEHMDLVDSHMHYSLSWVKDLSDMFYFRCSCFYLLDRVNWTRELKNLKKE